MPLVLTIDLKSPDPGMITRAAHVLREGGLVAFPTETVYGLGADATSPKAVRRLFQVKGRPASNPVIVHVLDIADVADVASDVPVMAKRLARAFWPGPLTLIVPRGRKVAAQVGGGRKTVAVRAPSHPVARALLSAAAVPIAAPSANPYGRASPTTATHVVMDLGDEVDVVIDGGPSEIGIESTIVDCSVRPAVVLRPGGVTLEALQEVAPSIRMARVATEHRPRSSGRQERHYAPGATMVLVIGERQHMRAVLAQAAGELSARGERVGIVAAREDLSWLGNLGANIRVVALAPLGDPVAAARDLFGTLRDLDGLGLTVILARDFGATGIARAVRDRLTRAAGGRVLDLSELAVDRAAKRVVALATTAAP